MDDRNETAAEHRYISLADCPICSQLDEVVASYYKYGWDDQTVPLPPAAALLGQPKTSPPLLLNCSTSDAVLIAAFTTPSKNPMNTWSTAAKTKRN